MTRDRVRLGFAIGSGDEVVIPVRHMVVTGQTQEAGKTTTLDALITRAGLRAITFVTKRGEAAFTSARRIEPYFREQADWKFVRSILEASRGEKLKFEQPWIMRAAKGARTLAEVHANVRRALSDPKVKGMNADMYLVLDAYLEDVVPQIDRVAWAKRIVLGPGVNAMDLTDISVEMQHLVIRSALDWVLEREEQTVVVIPEAWKFMPEGRGTPVKLAAESFIRQGAGLGNYLWIDSQDIAGVDKKTLKQVPVWILGVQREANEIKRTLDNIPASVKKPKAADVATLELGNFFACWSTHTIKTYVQPTWMGESDARNIAVGKRGIAYRTKGDGVPIERPRVIAADLIPSPEEKTVTEAEARALRDENDELRRVVERLERQISVAPSSNATAPESAPVSGRRVSGDAGSTPVGAIDEDDLYRRFKARLLDEAAKDPKMIRVLTARPSIEVAYTPARIEVDGTTPKGRICRLLATGWFDEGTTQGATRSELKRTGSDVNSGSISTVFNSLLKDGFITIDSGNVYRSVPGMKVNIVER